MPRADTPTKVDELGRKPFAFRIADLIRLWRGDESRVVGLYGAWGSGKTTVVNFIEDQLNSLRTDDRPVVFRFNPWEWNAQQNLTDAFFRELSAAIEHELPEGSSLPQKLRNYSAMLSVVSLISRSMQAIVSAAKPALVPLAGGVGAVIDASAQVLRGAASYEPDARPMSEVKHELRTSLALLKTNVVVILDDVDRLTSRETGELFQLIKANADFPRLVYLVVCDPAVVEAALSELIAGAARGAEFLDKIVQVGFHMPRLLPNQRERWLTDGVRDILRRYDIENQLDIVRWEDSYDEQAERYFDTPREIVRYLDSLDFVVGDLATRWRGEFDVVDFLLLEVLRLYERDLYEQLMGNKEELTGRHFFVKPEERAAYLHMLLTVVQTGRRHAAELMIRDLFPSFGSVEYRTLHRSRTSPVCEYDTFDRYFFFAVPPSELTSQALQDILDNRFDSELFLKDLREARLQGNLATLLDRLSDTPPSPTAAPQFLRALATFATELDPDEAAYRWPIYSEVRDRAWTALSIVNKANRDREFLALFAESVPLVGVLLLNSDRRSALPVSAAARKTARGLLANWAVTHAETILTAPGAEWLLATWWDVDRANARSFIQATIQSADSATQLITAFSRHALSDVHRPKKRRTELKIEWEALASIVDVRKLQKIVETVDERDLDIRARKALREFRREATNEARIRKRRRRPKKASSDV
jgi:predicted KAP-like P-loop ATPase